DQVEVSFSASGQPGRTVRRTRRLEFSADSLGGTLREGGGDPLAGAAVEGRTRDGRFAIGRLAPRWGRGLLLGAAAEPWSFVADDRGSGTQFRGRAGNGASYSGSNGIRYQALCGRFARKDLAGFCAGLGPIDFGAIGSRSADLQTSVSAASDDRSAECV